LYNLETETEWIETVKTGWNILLPPQSKEFPEKILSVSKPSIHPPLFGSDVSQKILSVLEQLKERRDIQWKNSQISLKKLVKILQKT
jgi:UDP-N-acetylglucosamine 2-epimerase